MKCEICGLHIHSLKHIEVYTARSIFSNARYSIDLLKKSNSHIICGGCINRLDIEKRKMVAEVLKSVPNPQYFIERAYNVIDVMTDEMFLNYKNALRKYEEDVKRCFDEIFNNIDIDFALELLEIEKELQNFKNRGKVTYSGIAKIYKVNVKTAKDVVEKIGTKAFTMSMLKEYDGLMAQKTSVKMRRYFSDEWN